MTDKISVIRCQGGLNETGSDLDTAAGEVRRSSNYEQVAAGGYHSLVLKADGSVVAFGYNGHGQLGDGSTTDRHSPVAVAALGGDNAQVAAGGHHSLVLKVGG